jgi:hypothetical protein
MWPVGESCLRILVKREPQELAPRKQFVQVNAATRPPLRIRLTILPPAVTRRTAIFGKPVEKGVALPVVRPDTHIAVAYERSHERKSFAA